MMQAQGLKDYFRAAVEPLFHELQAKYAKTTEASIASSSSILLSSSSSSTLLQSSSKATEVEDEYRSQANQANQANQAKVGAEEENAVRLVRTTMMELIASSNRIVCNPHFVSSKPDNAKYFEITINQSKILMSLLEILWWAQLKKLADYLKVPISEPEKAGSKYLLFDRKFYEMMNASSPQFPNLVESIELSEMFLNYCESKVFSLYVGSKYTCRIVLGILCADRIINFNPEYNTLTAAVTATRNESAEGGGVSGNRKKIASPYFMMSRLYMDQQFRGPLIIELRRLTAPEWLRQAAYQVVRDILSIRDGLISVMNVYLSDISENCNGTLDVSKLYMMVAKFLTSVPPNTDKIGYYRTISSQILDVFTTTVHVLFKNKNSDRKEALKGMPANVVKDLATISETANQFMILLTLMIGRLAHLQPDMCKEMILVPILQPLLKLNLCDSRNLTSSLAGMLEEVNEEEELEDDKEEVDGGGVALFGGDNNSINNNSRSNSDSRIHPTSSPKRNLRKSMFSYDCLAMSVNSIYSILTSTPLIGPIIKCLLELQGFEYFLTLSEMLDSYSAHRKVKVVEEDKYISSVMEKTKIIAQLYLTKCSNPDLIVSSIDNYLFSLPKNASRASLTIDNNGFLSFSAVPDSTILDNISRSPSDSNLTISSIIRAKSSNSSLFAAGKSRDDSSNIVDNSSNNSSNNNSNSYSNVSSSSSNGGGGDIRKGIELENVVSILQATSAYDISSQFNLKVSAKSQYLCNFIHCVKKPDPPSSSSSTPSDMILDNSFTLPVMSLFFMQYLHIYLSGEEKNEQKSSSSSSSRSSSSNSSIETGKDLNNAGRDESDMLINKSMSQNIIFMTVLSSVDVEDILSDGLHVLKILSTFLEGFSKSSYVIAKTSVTAVSSGYDSGLPPTTGGGGGTMASLLNEKFNSNGSSNSLVVNNSSLENSNKLARERGGDLHYKKKGLIEEISSTTSSLVKDEEEGFGKSDFKLNASPIPPKLTNSDIASSSSSSTTTSYRAEHNSNISSGSNHNSVNNDVDDEDTEISLEQLGIVLSLLSSILEFGECPRHPDEETIIRSMLQPLMTISWSDIKVQPQKHEEEDDDVEEEIDSDDEVETKKEEGEKESSEDANLSELAQKLVVKIMTRSKAKKASSSIKSDSSDSSSYSTAPTPTCDFKSISDIIDFVAADLDSPSPAERAMGLHIITENIRKFASASNSKLNIRDISLLIDTVIPFLADSDSFVYLHAVQAIRIVSDLKGCRAVVVDKLTNIFESVATTILSVKKNESSSAHNKKGSVLFGPSSTTSLSSSSSSLPAQSATVGLLLPIGRYTVLAEVLSLVLKRAGEAAAQYTPRVVSISIVLSRIILSKSEITLMDKHVDLCKTRLLKAKKKSEGDDELDESDEEVSNNYNEAEADIKEASKDRSVGCGGGSKLNISSQSSIVPPEKKLNLKGQGLAGGKNSLPSKSEVLKAEEEDKEAAAQVADYALLRQSAIILLSEAVVCSGWSCTRIADVLDVVSHVLVLEVSQSQYSISCRRAAALVLRHILTGLNKKLFSLSDAGQILKKCYNSVKIGWADRDDIVRFHCGVAMNSLDEMYLDKFKPTKAELKVRVLDWG